MLRSWQCALPHHTDRLPACLAVDLSSIVACAALSDMATSAAGVAVASDAAWGDGRTCRAAQGGEDDEEEDHIAAPAPEAVLHQGHVVEVLAEGVARNHALDADQQRVGVGAQ